MLLAGISLRKLRRPTFPPTVCCSRPRAAAFPRSWTRFAQWGGPRCNRGRSVAQARVVVVVVVGLSSLVERCGWEGEKKSPHTSRLRRLRSADLTAGAVPRSNRRRVALGFLFGPGGRRLATIL